ncbi:hypothetical protein J7K50_02690 [bacterium]|nr:hypothetical protein [bacterium]
MPADTGMTDRAELAKMTFRAIDAGAIKIPFGEIRFNEPGDYAFLPNDGGIVHFVYAGKADFVLDSLPDGDALNLFYEMGLAKKGEPIEIEADGFYAKCGPDSGMEEVWDGVPVEVDPENPPEFFERLWGYYVQSWSDAIPVEKSKEEMMAAMMGGGAAGPAVRDPEGREFHISVFTPDGGRFDFREKADGRIVITDYLEGFAFYEHPYHAGEEDFEPGIDFLSKAIEYRFDPETQDCEILVLTRSRATQDMDEYTVYCYPWIELLRVEVDGKETEFERHMTGDKPEWGVTIKHPFEEGKEYEFYFVFSGEAPKSYDAIGFAGVYRFDDYVVYTGADACDKTMYAEMLSGGEWQFIESPGSSTRIDEAHEHEAEWPNSCRGVMLVSTQFPMSELESGSVTLEVYAPEDLIGSIGENPAVTELGQMLDYYSGEFGVFSEVYPDGEITRQPLFLIPDEGGVAAFENAGLLFYLGSQTGSPLIAHEVSHIWWGQMVDGPLWFVEGMANYCSTAYLEEYDKKKGDSYRRYLVQAAVARGKPMSLDRRMELGDMSAIYQHGTAMFVTLARIYGKDELHRAFMEICAEYTDAPEMTADQIFDELSESLNADLDDFRVGFFDYTVPPTVDVTATELGSREGGHSYSVEVRRDGRLAGLLPIDIEFDLQSGETELVTINSVGAGTALEVEFSDAVVDITIDPENRLLINTEAREMYQRFLGWLMPAWMKRGSGDTAGAIYCFERAIEYRCWARDYNDLAGLYFSVGRVDEARAMVNEMLSAAALGEDFGEHEIEVGTLCKIHWLAGKIAEKDGDVDAARVHFEKVIELGNKTGLYNLVRSAQKKLGIEEEETEGAMPAGMPGAMG